MPFTNKNTMRQKCEDLHVKANDDESSLHERKLNAAKV